MTMERKDHPGYKYAMAAFSVCPVFVEMNAQLPQGIEAWFNEQLDGNAGDDRFYHNDIHVLEVLGSMGGERGIEELGTSWGYREQSAGYILAAIFHDIHYVVGDKYNEEKSVLKMRNACPITPVYGATMRFASGLIMGTKFYSEGWSATRRNDATAYFNSHDMWSFRQPSLEVSLEKERLLAQEFTSEYSVEAYFQGRKEFLETLAKKWPDVAFRCGEISASLMDVKTEIIHHNRVDDKFLVYDQYAELTGDKWVTKGFCGWNQKKP